MDYLIPDNSESDLSFGLFCNFMVCLYYVCSVGLKFPLGWPYLAFFLGNGLNFYDGCCRVYFVYPF